MRPSPQHAGALPASGVTSLQVARSFFADFLEFVPNAVIKYRFARHNDRLPEFAAGSDAFRSLDIYSAAAIFAAAACSSW
jgi:hypothetical protein